MIDWLRETWKDGRYQDQPQDDWVACKGGSLNPWLPESLARGLVALLATPFLLLAMLAVAYWLTASARLPVRRQMVFASSGEQHRPQFGDPSPRSSWKSTLASADVVEIQGDTVCVVAVQSGVVIGPVG